MDLVYKTALVIIPEQSTWEPIQEIRKEYDPKIRRWMPHVTLLYPFVPIEQFEKISEVLAPVCEKFEPFTINLNDLDYFAKNKILWINPEPQDKMFELHKALADALNYPKAKKPFTAHMTVGRFQGRNQLRKTHAELKEKWQNLEFTLTKISLISREDPPDDIFKVDKELSLKQS